MRAEIPWSKKDRTTTTAAGSRAAATALGGTARMRGAVEVQNETDSHAFSTAASLAGMRGAGEGPAVSGEAFEEKPAVEKERPVQMTRVFFVFFF